MVSKSEVALVKSEDLKAADAVGVVAAWRNRDQGQALNGCCEKKSQIADDKKSMEGGIDGRRGGRRNRLHFWGQKSSSLLGTKIVT